LTDVYSPSFQENGKEQVTAKLKCSGMHHVFSGGFFSPFPGQIARSSVADLAVPINKTPS